MLSWGVPPSDLALPLARLPMPAGEALDLLLSEATRAVDNESYLPTMVLAGTVRERLAVTRTGLDRSDSALAESGLRAQAGVLWTALAGEAVMASGMGVLRHAFVRVRHPGARWEAAWRPFIATGTHIAWLGDWTRDAGTGAHPEHLEVMFPEPAEGTVRFIKDLEIGEPSVAREVPEGATTRDVAQAAGILLESFFVKKGFVPPTVVRFSAEAGLEVFLLPRTGPRHHATDTAIRMAQDPSTLGVGLFERGRDEAIQPPAEQIRMRLEFRDGPTLIWRRRFRVHDQNRARWLDHAGDVLEAEDPARRWFV